ncbi:hypothetical protein EDC05_004458 [Coemansia umbellata]|uniref:6,7-dimethyl-8-ribityllumazine synthase n=2 Tax=Coemansia TaxID=4863 RepID=A0ABQ8PI78_9FUNG|nr:hypothetical protein EDC05_004458 [Coemansia umbellata]
MKAVTNLRTRMRLADPIAEIEPQDATGTRRRARTSSGPLCTELPATRSWHVEPRKLRGLHPAPLIVYTRENPSVVAPVMDALWDTLVSRFNIDAKDIRVTNVPTIYDLPGAVRRMGRSKQVVIAVGMATRDTVWFDEKQLGSVREFLLGWSQSTEVPLVDGVLAGCDARELMFRACSTEWPDGCLFGQHLAQRAIEMFYIEHRGW